MSYPTLSPPLPTFLYDPPLKFPLQQNVYIYGSILKEDKHFGVADPWI